jgi:hypothetical protein
MNVMKQAMAVLGTVVVIATIVALVAPKTAHAIVATAVQVVNTSANPIPTPRSATRFQAALCNVTGPVATAYGVCPPPTNTATFTVPTATSTGAPVKRLIVDNVSGFCSNYTTSSLIIKAVRLRGQFAADSVPNGNSFFTHYVPMIGDPYSYVNDPALGPPIGGVPENDYAFGQVTNFALNPGDTVSLDVWYFFQSANTSADWDCVARVEGYLVTQ